MMCLVALALISSAGALSLDQVRVATERHHPLVRAALEELRSDRGALQAADGAFDAKLVGEHQRVASGFWSRTYTDAQIEKPLKVANAKAYAGYSYGFNGLFPPQFSTLSTNSGGAPRVGLSFALLRGLAVDEARAGLQVATTQVQAAVATATLARWDLARYAEVAYWEWVAARKVMSTYERLLQNALSRESYLRQRVDRGDAPAVILSENAQYIARRRSALLAAQQRHVRAKLDLSLFYRDDQGAPIPIPDDEAFDDFPASAASTVGFTGAAPVAPDDRPEIRVLRAQVEQREVELRLALNNRLPRLDAWGDYTQNIGGEDRTNPDHAWAFGLRFEIPLERDFIRGEIATARSRRDAQLARHRYGVESFRNQEQGLREALVLQQKQLEQTQDEFRFATALVEVETLKFKTGGSNLFLVNLREEAAADAEANLHDAHNTFIAARLTYQQLVKPFDPEAL